MKPLVRFGKGAWVPVDEKLRFEDGFGATEVMVKTAKNGAAYLVVTRDDGAEPYFQKCRALPGFVVDKCA